MRPACISFRSFICSLLITMTTVIVSTSAYADRIGSSANAKPKKAKTIAIIGNSELPKVDVVLPWRVPSDGDPTKISLEPVAMPDVLAPITVDKHKARVYFHRHGKISVDRFTN